VLQIQHIKMCLNAVADEALSLSKSQIISIVSSCDIAHDGSVKYAVFAPVAAEMIYGMTDFASQKKRLDAVTALSSSVGRCRLTPD